MKKAILAAAVAMAATGAQADDWLHRGDGFSLFGDVEINFDVNKEKRRDDSGARNSDSIKIGDDSRVLAGLQWRHSLENGNFVTAVGEALLKTTGDLEMDDAFFAMGNKDNWFFQLGRYEAWDLFPLGMDVAFTYADGSDEVDDAFNLENGLYVYRAAEARGRASGAGQARVQGQMNGFTAELSTLYGETRFNSLDGNRYDSDNSFMIRPVVNYMTDDGFLSVSLGGEWEARKISSDKRILNTVDTHDRYGLGATTTMQFGPLAWHISGAYQSVKDFRKAYSIGSNVEFMEQWGLGFVYAHNKHDNKVTEGGFDDDYKKPKGYTIYGAYSMPVLGIDNANVIFGLSYSQTKNAVDFVRDINKDKQSDIMFRTRFLYTF